MYEKQPILIALIKTGYVGAPCLKGFTINEKTQKGVAIIQLKHETKPSKLYWDKNEDAWTEKRPAYYNEAYLKSEIHPNIAV